MEIWSKTCYLIQIRYSGKEWRSVEDTYFRGSGAARRHASREGAKAAFAKLNKQIKGGYWEYETTEIPERDMRIIQMTTTWTVTEN